MPKVLPAPLYVGRRPGQEIPFVASAYIYHPCASWLKFKAHLVDMDCWRTFPRTGNRMPTRMVIIPMTTSSSTNVNARRTLLRSRICHDTGTITTGAIGMIRWKYYRQSSEHVRLRQVEI